VFVPEVTLVSSIERPLADAPVLVLGNPIGTSRDVWSHQVPVLSRYFRVLQFETRGHGAPGSQSAAPPGPYTIAELGADVLALLNSYGFERVAYAGVSLGGMIGLWLAANAPERIRSLAVCCAALTPLPSPDSWHERAALARSSGMAALADMVVPRWFTPSFVSRSPGEVAAVVAMLTETNPVGYAGCAEAIAAMDLRPLLGLVKAPTLVLSGAEDPAAPPSVGGQTALGIADSRLVVVRGASHLAHYEKPGPVTAALLAHFQATASLAS
jgi:3-oxoadipate enol-lactonase